MAKKPTPLAGEATTTNYGWVKPTVGSSVDLWGGYINADLDSIDATVKSVSVVANAAYPASNPSGYQTAAQVASVVIGDNRIINGDMRIDQRNNGASGNASGYTVDRWIYQASQAGKLTWGRVAPVALPPLGFAYALSLTSIAYTLLAADSFNIRQIIEADMVSDFAWGTPNAQPVTLSFLAFCDILTGTFSGSIKSADGSRSYPFTFSLPTANTWTKIAVTIPGDTAGTWVMSGNAAAMLLVFDLGSGATSRAPAGAWASGNFNGANGAVNIFGTNATFRITGVKLETGSVATPFNRQSLAKSMADCQRYYQTLSGVQWGSYSVTGNIFYTTVSLPTYMRAAPTVALNTQTYGSAAAAVTGAITNGAVTVNATSTATGTSWAALNFTASAEL